MDQASISLADRFRMALDLCDAAGARTDATPVVSELRQRQVTFEEPPRFFPSGPAVAPSGPLPPAAPPLPVPPSVAAPAPYWHPAQAPQQPHAEELCSQQGGVGSTLKAIAVVLGVLLVAGAVWFLKQRLVARFLARKSQQETPPPRPDLEQAPPRSAWRNQFALERPRPPQPAPPARRVSFKAGAEQQPRPATRPQAARSGGRAATPEEESRRRALLAAHGAARGRVEVEEVEVAVEEGGEELDDEDGEDGVDPNFTEI